MRGYYGVVQDHAQYYNHITYCGTLRALCLRDSYRGRCYLRLTCRYAGFTGHSRRTGSTQMGPLSSHSTFGRFHSVRRGQSRSVRVVEAVGKVTFATPTVFLRSNHHAAPTCRRSYLSTDCPLPDLRHCRCRTASYNSSNKCLSYPKEHIYATRFFPSGV